MALLIRLFQRKKFTIEILHNYKQKRRFEQIKVDNLNSIIIKQKQKFRRRKIKKINGGLRMEIGLGSLLLGVSNYFALSSQHLISGSLK